MAGQWYSTRLIEEVKQANQESAGVKLGLLCIAKNYSVREVAEYLGVSRVAVYRWFRGCPVSSKHLARVHDLIAKLQ